MWALFLGGRIKYDNSTSQEELFHKMFYYNYLKSKKKGKFYEHVVLLE